MSEPVIVAMVPARIGSQRLTKKNLRELAGVPLLERAVRKAHATGVFDEVWVNGTHDAFREVAERCDARFHKRPEALSSNTATSEDYIREFLATHAVDYVVQVHSIAPLLTVDELRGFVAHIRAHQPDMLVSVVQEQIECMYEGRPVNFTFDEKTNSQELTPVERVTWSVTAWRAAPFLAAMDAGTCATYAGTVHTYPVNRLAGHIIKTADDLAMAEALLPLVDGNV